MKHYKELLCLSILSALTACGGSSSGNDKNADPVANTGVFLDSPVINIGYRTETLEGITNSKGEYQYLAGETVTFFIGDLIFPAVKATGTVTPLDLADTKDINDSDVVNMIRLLQTLDQDANPDNGITITEAAKSAATQVDFGLSESEFENAAAVTSLITNGGQDSQPTTLVETSAAIEHFNQSLINEGVLPSPVVGAWLITDEPEINIGGSDLSFLLLLPSGKYYMAESNEINEGDGFEFGSYTFANSTLSITTTVDTNSAIGFSAVSTASNLTIDLSESAFTFPTDDPRESGNYTFTKQALSQSMLGGAWLSEDGLAMFVFLNNGEYIAFQSEEENDFIGFEWGNFSLEGSTLTVSTIDNSDGEALFCDNSSGSVCQDTEFQVSVQEDTLTLTVPQEGNFNLIKHY